MWIFFFFFLMRPCLNKGQKINKYRLKLMQVKMTQGLAASNCETDAVLSDWPTGRSMGRPRRRRWAARSACCGRSWAWRTTSAPIPSWWPRTRTLAFPVAGTRSGSSDGACRCPRPSHHPLLCSHTSQYSFHSDQSPQVYLWKQTPPFCLSSL